MSSLAAQHYERDTSTVYGSDEEEGVPRRMQPLLTQPTGSRRRVAAACTVERVVPLRLTHFFASPSWFRVLRRTHRVQLNRTRQGEKGVTSQITTGNTPAPLTLARKLRRDGDRRARAAEK